MQVLPSASDVTDQIAEINKPRPPDASDGRRTCCKEGKKYTPMIGHYGEECCPWEIKAKDIPQWEYNGYSSLTECVLRARNPLSFFTGALGVSNFGSKLLFKKTFPPQVAAAATGLNVGMALRALHDCSISRRIMTCK